MGLLVCPDCASFKEFREPRPGRNDFLSEKGRSCSNTRDLVKLRNLNKFKMPVDHESREHICSYLLLFLL